MLKSLFSALIIALPAVGAHAQQTNVQTTASAFVAQCAAQTHARGKFSLDFSGAIPQVASGSKASARSINNVNDCLADKYQTQPGLVTVAQVASPTRNGRDVCARLRNRAVGESVLLAAGSALLGGVVGAGIHGGVLARNHADCRNGSVAQNASDGPFEVYSCRRKDSVLQGGTGYCRR